MFWIVLGLPVVDPMHELHVPGHQPLASIAVAQVAQAAGQFYLLALAEAQVALLHEPFAEVAKDTREAMGCETPPGGELLKAHVALVLKK